MFLITHVTLVTVVIFMVSQSLTSAATIKKNAVPPEWENICQADENSDILKSYLLEFKEQDKVVHLKCLVSSSSVGWRFSVLRDHLNRTLNNVSVFLYVECSTGSKISLPWPMKAPGVVGVSINNCILTDKYADLWNPLFSNMKTALRVLEIRNSNWLSESFSFNFVLNNLSSITKDFDCGHSNTIEYMVNSNVSDIVDPRDLKPQSSVNIFKNFNFSRIPGFKEAEFNARGSNSQSHRTFIHRLSLENATSTSTSVENMLSKLGEINVHKCNFSRLRVLEESYPTLMIVNYFKILVRTNFYPEIKVLNFSRSGISEMPVELVDFRKYFPKLTYMDLSRNNMTEVKLPSHFNPGSQLTLNVSYNKITRLTLDDLIAVSEVEGLFLDFRGNPIHCGCEMADLLLKMKSADFFTGKLMPYSYIKNVECASPFHLLGRRLSSLVVMWSPVDIRCNVDKRNQTSRQGVFRTSRLWAFLVCTTTTGPVCNII
uniref:LRRCT domain-containing protein n=1 Tax=Biomphalaria glabrata TaxID=6526 RepID=A0A2C9KJI5_BIOGL